MFSEAFWTPNIASSQFDEYSQLGSRTNVLPIKNGLKADTQGYTNSRDFADCELVTAVCALRQLVIAHVLVHDTRHSAAFSVAPVGC